MPLKRSRVTRAVSLLAVGALLAPMVGGCSTVRNYEPQVVTPGTGDPKADLKVCQKQIGSQYPEVVEGLKLGLVMATAGVAISYIDHLVTHVPVTAALPYFVGIQGAAGVALGAYNGNSTGKRAVEECMRLKGHRVVQDEFN